MKTKSEIGAYILRGSAAALLVSCVIVAFSSAISLPNKRPRVPALENNMSFGVNAREGTATVATSAIRRNQTLTFADRVAYQRAIEEVYWRHRIWPEANAGAKPSLDNVMPQEAIEKKVQAGARGLLATADHSRSTASRDGAHRQSHDTA